MAQGSCYSVDTGFWWQVCSGPPNSAFPVAPRQCFGAGDHTLRSRPMKEPLRAESGPASVLQLPRSLLYAVRVENWRFHTDTCVFQKRRIRSRALRTYNILFTLTLSRLKEPRPENQLPSLRHSILHHPSICDPRNFE